MIPTKCIAVMKKHKDEVWNVKFSSTGNRLASVGKDQLLYIWSITKVNNEFKIRCTHEIKGHTKNILALNWTNTDDRWVITAGTESVAKVWDSKTGALVMELKGHKDAIQSACFLPDDSKIVTVGVDKQIILWDIKFEGSSPVFQAKQIDSMDTKNYMDLAVSNTRIVSIGCSN